MAMLAALGGASGTSVDKLDSSSVFSTYLYTGNGSTQTINNGIDLAGKGGMVWIKGRGPTAYNHMLYDTVRTAGYFLSSSTTNASTYNADGLSAFNAYGYSLGNLASINGTENFTSWTFRKAPKFFDVVTYTGDGVAGRQIAHNLGCEVGMIVVKSTSSVNNWYTFHRGTTDGSYLTLNTANAESITSRLAYFGDGVVTVNPTSSIFTVGTGLNASGGTYVAYLYAHDTSEDGIIQCGSYVCDGTESQAVNLGFEPQYILYKRSDGTSNWQVVDNMRGMTVDSSGTYSRVYANLADAETTNSASAGNPRITSTGLLINGVGVTGYTYIYMAIRRPNKVPTSGSEVYKAIARTGTGAVATVTGVGFAPDLAVTKSRTSASNTPHFWYDRLRGVSNPLLDTSGASAEQGGTNPVTSFDMSGVTLNDSSGWGVNMGNGPIYINHFFKRAKGFFDNFCWTGTGANRTIAHNLGVVPELLILKSRSAAGDWQVWFSGLASNEKLVLNSTAAKVTDAALLNSTLPTSSVFSVGTGSSVNASGTTYVAYLFATLAGVSKVGSYTGNGTSQTINCGFSTGARFVLIKRTDSTGDWYIWDTARGIVAENDPHLSLNTTAAEVTTDDSIDPESTGFIVNQNTATNINVTSATYIYLAIS